MSTIETCPSPFRFDPSCTDYDSDLRLWSVAQAAALRRRDFDAVDIGNLILHLASLKDQQLKSFTSLCSTYISTCLIMEFCSDPSETFLYGLRRCLSPCHYAFRRIFMACPSLRPEFDQSFADAWKTARSEACRELALLSLAEYDEDDFDNASSLFDSLLPQRNPCRFVDVTGFELLPDGFALLDHFIVPPARVLESIERRRNS